jgi:hypothetical protein
MPLAVSVLALVAPSDVGVDDRALMETLAGGRVAEAWSAVVFEYSSPAGAGVEVGGVFVIGVGDKLINVAVEAAAAAGG